MRRGREGAALFWVPGRCGPMTRRTVGRGDHQHCATIYYLRMPRARALRRNLRVHARVQNCISWSSGPEMQPLRGGMRSSEQKCTAGSRLLRAAYIAAVMYPGISRVPL